MSITQTVEEKQQIAAIAAAAHSFAASHAEFEDQPEGYSEDLAALMETVLSFGDENGQEDFQTELATITPVGYLLTYCDAVSPHGPIRETENPKSVVIRNYTPATWLIARAEVAEYYHLLNVLPIYEENEWQMLADMYNA